jgi:hypothetical protein
MITYSQCVAIYGGSGTCMDRAQQHYRSLGYTGTLYDMEFKFLGDEGYTGTWWDRWNAYLGAQGRTGTLRDRFSGGGRPLTNKENANGTDNLSARSIK